MSEYTTGELARLCGVTVRTVQYYDSRGILVPSRLSEGGRRLYSEADLSRMRIICFLRDAGISIDSIGKLLSSEHPERVISVLIEEREKELCGELGDVQCKLNTLAGLRGELRSIDSFSFESIGDIALILKNKRKLRAIHTNMIAVGILMDIIQLCGIACWIFKGEWIAFAVGETLAVIMGILISVYYMKNTVYICPNCHSVFRASFKESFFALHTPRLRRLRCPHCNEKSFCIETCGGKEKNKEGIENA